MCTTSAVNRPTLNANFQIDFAGMGSHNKLARVQIVLRLDFKDI